MDAAAMMNPEQYEIESMEWWRARAMQLECALEAVMLAHGVGQGMFGGWYVYQAADGGADAFPVDDMGNRVVITPTPPQAPTDERGA